MTRATIRLYWELAWARALLWVAGAGRTAEPKPEVHLYLADLHFKLAADLESRGRWGAARRHRRIANEHAVLATPPEPKPAVAMAMPVPRPAVFTDARGKQLHDPTTDD